MNRSKKGHPLSFLDNVTVQIAIYAFLVILMTNLNSLADLALHPQIPYWDEEHLIVGGLTGLIAFTGFGCLLLYVRHLHDALNKIKELEAILPICSYCKKIRKPDSDPSVQDSWQEIERYITENTSSRLSHGICPECQVKMYPGVWIR